jgi:hypothetical protein
MYAFMACVCTLCHESLCTNKYILQVRWIGRSRGTHACDFLWIGRSRGTRACDFLCMCLRVYVCVVQGCGGSGSQESKRGRGEEQGFSQNASVRLPPPPPPLLILPAPLSECIKGYLCKSAFCKNEEQFPGMVHVHERANAAISGAR